MDKDITSEVEFGVNDGECLPLLKCVCGKKFKYWDFYIPVSHEKELVKECPSCKRKMYFTISTRVYELIKKED